MASPGNRARTAPVRGRSSVTLHWPSDAHWVVASSVVAPPSEGVKRIWIGAPTAVLPSGNRSSPLSAAVRTPRSLVAAARTVTPASGPV